MNYKVISTSEGRKNLPKIIREVDEGGQIYVLTTHGKARVAMIDIDLFEEFTENIEYGISEKELIKRADESTVSLEELKKILNV